MKPNTAAGLTNSPTTPLLTKVSLTPTDFTILVVDDQEETRFSIRLLLESEGYRVLTATTGSEAVAQLQGAAVDLVIMDYLMPRLSGKQLIHELRKHHPNVQILLQTGYSGEENLIELMHTLDIQGYHSKIDGPDRLLLWVKILCRDAGYTRKLAQERHSILNLFTLVHEMRTRLHFILAHSQLLLTEGRLLLPPSIQQSLTALARHQARFESLTAPPSPQSYNQTPLIDCDLALVHIADYAHDVRALVRSVLHETPVQFVCEVSDQLAPIRIDPNKLLVIVHNLIEYAAAGTSHGKLRLFIRSSPTGERLIIEIQASGIDNTAEAEAIIASFAQVTESLPSSVYSKITHGLAVAYHMAIELGGTFAVTHTTEAEATFTVTFPIDTTPSPSDVGSP